MSKKSTCAKIAQIKKEGDQEIKQKIKYYIIDIIIAVGYIVNSKRGTEFRICADKILKGFLIKKF